MKKKWNPVPAILIALVMVLGTVSTAWGHENKVPEEIGQPDPGGIPAPYMSISYNGRHPDLPAGVCRPEGKDILFFIQVADSVENDVFPVENELFGMGKKIKKVGRALLRYIFMEDQSLSHAFSHFQIKSMMDDAHKRLTDDFGLNLSFHLGYDEDVRMGAVNAVKVSSFCFSTYLDAVYDYKNNSIDLFLSNARLNQYLLDDMILEFQFCSKASAGAFLMTMQF